ncbi:hypothetical protein U1Q18_044088, partial [Sarracenia purpurea var. burkii]
SGDAEARNKTQRTERGQGRRGTRDEGRGEGGPRRHRCPPPTPSPASCHAADQRLRLELRSGRESSRQGKRRRGCRSPSPVPTFIGPPLVAGEERGRNRVCMNRTEKVL